MVYMLIPFTFTIRFYTCFCICTQGSIASSGNRVHSCFFFQHICRISIIPPSTAVHSTTKTCYFVLLLSTAIGLHMVPRASTLCGLTQFISFLFFDIFCSSIYSVYRLRARQADIYRYFVPITIALYIHRICCCT
jgi:hypothetical protein